MSVNIEAIMKKELEQIILHSLAKKIQDGSDDKLRMLATMLSWMIYGASVDWEENSLQSPEKYFEEASLAIRELIMNAIT